MTLVTRTDRNGAATLTLNRPDKLNALNVELFKELDAHSRKLATETETVGLVIVRGAGRCFSADRPAHGSARVMGPCMAMGQATGTAAAMMVARGLGEVRALEVQALRAKLAADGAILTGTH